MSRKSKGECTCKIVAQNERGMLGQVRDSVYRGVKYCGDGGQVEKMFRFPRKLSEEKWLEWLDADFPVMRSGYASVAARCGNREVPQSFGGRKGGEVGE